ncbi:MAG: hypothetical protein ITG00_09845 [Flavobacterium sp.]|nr:hypothetical protein [Flavobacterium sp.]
MKKVLPLFSWLLHPVLIPLLATAFYFLIYDSYMTKGQQYLVYLQVAIITFFIPVSFFFLLRSLGKIDTVMAGNVSQRKMPLLIQSVLLFILITKGITIERIPELYFFLLSALASTLCALLFSLLKVKISLHMMGIGALTLFVIFLSISAQYNAVYYIAGLVLLNGMVASSRLAMKAHSGTELVLGFICGVLPQIAIGYAYL